MASWETTVVAGALGIAFGGATALIQTALSARAKTSEELRGLRLEAYPAIWRETALFYRDAAADLNWEDLEPPQLALRSWYFTSGGLLLSRRSTARLKLNDLQSLLSAYLVRSEAAGERINQADYTAITETCSALRTALTADLSTREQRTIVGVVASWRWHRLESRKAKRRIDAIGRGKMSYPRKKLDL